MGGTAMWAAPVLPRLRGECPSLPSRDYSSLPPITKVHREDAELIVMLAMLRGPTCCTEAL